MWFDIFRKWIPQFEENQIPSSIECFQCTQVGFPVFHSTSCNRSDQPEWEASAGSSLVPIQNRVLRHTRVISYRLSHGPFGRVLDPRSKSVRRWNRVFLLARGMSLVVDPLFFYVLTIGHGGELACLYKHDGFEAAVIFLRTCVDAVHLWHVWLQFRLAYVSKESLVVGCGKLVWDARAIASHYIRSPKGFWFDLFVILPVPQVVFWLAVPRLMKEEKIILITAILQLIFLFQFLPKVYHIICLMRRMQKVTGYIFGPVWWDFGINLFAYFIASHFVGACWYVLAVQRVGSCMEKQCVANTCNVFFHHRYLFVLIELEKVCNGKESSVSLVPEQ